MLLRKEEPADEQPLLAVIVCLKDLTIICLPVVFIKTETIGLREQGNVTQITTNVELLSIKMLCSGAFPPSLCCSVD